jgi:hypothetical protein
VVLVENLQDRQRLEDLGVDWRIIFNLIFKYGIVGGGVYWIDLTQDTDM